MKERIKELAEQAGYEPDMFGAGHWDMPECQRFVELIIKECALQCVHNEDMDLIEQHFGVEE